MDTEYIIVALVVIVGSAVMIYATRNLLSKNKNRKGSKSRRRRGR